MECQDRPEAVVGRPTITWPKQARAAFWEAPNVEHYECLPAYDGRNPWQRMPYPDVQQCSYQRLRQPLRLLAHAWPGHLWHRYAQAT